jgi:hypothetical protein
MCIIDSDSWQYEDDMLTDLFQPSRSDPLQHSHDDFQPYPRGCDTYSFEHLELFYEEDFQPPLCSDFDEHEAMIHLGKKEFNSRDLQISFSSSCNNHNQCLLVQNKIFIKEIDN